MQFIPFFITDKNTPIDEGIEFALSRHQLNDLNKASVRLAYRFLYQYRGSADTFNTYRKEVEKLFQFFYVNGPAKVISRLRADDLERFFEFSVSPTTPWIATSAERRLLNGQPNPSWRPFSLGRSQGGQTSSKSLKSLFAVISSFYDYLTNEGAAEYNPVRNIRQKSRFFVRGTKDPVRRLSNQQVEYLLAAAANNDRPERAIWIVSLLLHCYLRISEIVSTDYHTPVMGDIHKDEDGVWWIKIVGKGRKERLIPLPSETIAAMKPYRESLNLTPYPLRGDKTPLLHDARYKTKLVPVNSSRSIRIFMDGLFEQAKALMQQDGYSYECDAFDAATVHWLRHTGISEDVKRRPKEHVKEDAGHGSMVVTERYIDTELKERAASRQNK